MHLLHACALKKNGVLADFAHVAAAA